MFDETVPGAARAHCCRRRIKDVKTRAALKGARDFLHTRMVGTRAIETKGALRLALRSYMRVCTRDHTDAEEGNSLVECSRAMAANAKVVGVPLPFWRRVVAAMRARRLINDIGDFHWPIIHRLLRDPVFLRALLSSLSLSFSSPLTFTFAPLFCSFSGV